MLLVGSRDVCSLQLATRMEGGACSRNKHAPIAALGLWACGHEEVRDIRWALCDIQPTVVKETNITCLHHVLLLRYTSR